MHTQIIQQRIYETHPRIRSLLQVTPMIKFGKKYGLTMCQKWNGLQNISSNSSSIPVVVTFGYRTGISLSIHP